jgi:hypothetical protein
MADERDPQVSRRYRELGADEPPPALDQAILAASRQALAQRRRRWYLPLAAAAVALLAVGVALQVERQQPDPEAVTAPTTPQPSTDGVPTEQPAPAAPKVRKREAAPSRSPDDAAARKEDALGGLSRRRAEESRSREVPPAAAPVPQTAPAARPGPAAALAESPERWLERIAELRMQGRHDDADKALAEFRKRYPEYRIPDSTLEKVERNK